MKEDLNETHLLFMIKKITDYSHCQTWLRVLKNHWAEKTANLYVAAADTAHWQRTHVNVMKNILFTEQYNQVMSWIHDLIESPLPVNQGLFKNILCFSILCYLQPFCRSQTAVIHPHRQWLLDQAVRQDPPQGRQQRQQQRQQQQRQWRCQPQGSSQGTHLWHS